MRILKPCVFAAGVLLSLSSFAMTQTDAQLRAQIRKITLETASLQRQVNELEIALHRRNHYRHREVRERHRILHRRVHYPVKHSARIPHTLTAAQEEEGFPFRHAVTVTTSPFMGVKSAFDASDLLEQQSTWNEDMILIQQRALLERQLVKEGDEIERPILELSGGVEGQAIYANGFGGASSTLALSKAELDMNAVVNDWTNGFISLDYDGSPVSVGNRMPNSRIFLRRAFMSFGNFNKFPFYFTIGQFYMPFGRYSSALLTAPLTLSLARVVSQGVLLGFVKNGIYASIYGYGGNQSTLRRRLFVEQGGANLGYKNSKIDIGAGLISNIADSEGMQNNGLGSVVFFNGFGTPTNVAGVLVPGFNNLRHRVGAADGHVELALGPFSILGEYISSVQRFNPADMTFNGRGALPSVMHAELDYLFYINQVPITLGAAYGRTWQAFALNLPQQSFWGVISASILRDTVEAIEFRHDINYPLGTFATGGTFVFPVPYPTSLGGTRNTLTAQVGVYF